MLILQIYKHFTFKQYLINIKLTLELKNGLVD